MGEFSYRSELDILEELLDEAAGGQPEHAVGQEVRHLRVQADVFKRVRELLLNPAQIQTHQKPLHIFPQTTIVCYTNVVKFMVAHGTLWCYFLQCISITKPF